MIDNIVWFFHTLFKGCENFMWWEWLIAFFCTGWVIWVAGWLGGCLWWIIKRILKIRFKHFKSIGKLINRGISCFICSLLGCRFGEYTREKRGNRAGNRVWYREVRYCKTCDKEDVRLIYIDDDDFVLNDEIVSNYIRQRYPEAVELLQMLDQLRLQK